MYSLHEHQVTYILNDIRKRGVEMEDLQLNLLDHICCLIENELEEGGDFEACYRRIIRRFYTNDLREIEDETRLLLKYKNYYPMKKVMIISGITSAATFIIFSVFKLMFWPGAIIAFFISVVIFSFVFLPLMFILKTKEAKSNLEKLSLAAGTISGILYCMATLFSVQHWPGSRVLWLCTVGCSIFVFIPAHFFSAFRKPGAKINTIVTTVILIAVTGLIFTMLRLKPPAGPDTNAKIYAYMQSDDLLKKMQRNLNRTTVTHSENTRLVAQIQNTCDQIKGLILQKDIGQSFIPRDFEAKNMVIDERSLGSDFMKGSSGAELLTDLKKSVNRYNALKNTEENKIPTGYSILDIDQGKISDYSNIFVLMSITQLELYLVNAEYSLIAEN